MAREVHDVQKVPHSFYVDLLQSLKMDFLHAINHQSVDNLTLKSLQNDVNRFEKRLLKEGVGFVLHALPNIAKAMLSGFATGVYVTPQGFKAKSAKDVRPKFLWVMHQHIFDAEGNLLDSNGSLFITCARFIYQISVLFYKMESEEGDSPQAIAKKIQSWKDVEHELEYVKIYSADPVIAYAREMVASIFSEDELGVTVPHPKAIRPKHGPGAVSEEGVKGMGKWNMNRASKLNRVYPFKTYFASPETFHLDVSPLNSARDGCIIATGETLHEHFNRKLEALKYYERLAPKGEPVSRFSVVPKDSRGPRCIAMEPTAAMYIQQGIKEILYTYLEHDCRLTRGRINFRDQSINRRLAQLSSLTGEYATLDLSDASDRVTLKLVRELFADCPTWLSCIEACRTDVMRIPKELSGAQSDEFFRLNKFAGMGSALTFPLEALTFYALLYGLATHYGCEFDAYVYGDDIIVPSELAELAITDFPNYGLKVNNNKTFTSGPFRESCGMDALNGIPITPVRLRTTPWNKTLCGMKKVVGVNASKITSFVAFSNLLYQNQMKNSSRYIKKYLSRVFDPSLSKKIVNCSSPLTSPILAFPPDERWEELKVHGITPCDEYVCVELMGGITKTTHPKRRIFTDLHYLYGVEGIYPKQRRKPDQQCLDESQALLSGLLSSGNKTRSISDNRTRPIPVAWMNDDNLQHGMSPFRLKDVTVPLESLYDLAFFEPVLNLDRIQNPWECRIPTNKSNTTYNILTVATVGLRNPAASEFYGDECFGV